MGKGHVSKRYFGTDGIRGQANKHPMTADVAMRVGMAVGLHYHNGHRQKVVIGKDTRLSNYMIETALVAGFTAVGVDVFQLGPIPTPGVAMLTRSLRADYGVMISASHNPFDDNGIKLFGPDGFKLSDQDEEEIEALIDSDLSSRLAASADLGRAKRIDGGAERYVEAAKRTLPRDMSFEGFRVIVDCANGAGYKAAPMALEELGAEVIALGVEPDGLNINREVGSTSPKALAQMVKERRADLGIALDGDADRVVLIDEKGSIVDGDQLMAVVASFWKEEGRLTGGGVVATVMSNLGLERFLAGCGLKLARTPVGDRYVSEHMREHGYNVGGEQSGHIILSDFTTTGDGLIAALQVLAVIRRDGRPASEVCRRFEPVPQVLKNFRYKGGQPLENDQVKRLIAEAETKLKGGGRLVIRPSGTEPVIRIMGEGDNADLVEAVVNDIVTVLGQAA
jgi:phosphoglucosamine mutase